MAIEKNISEPMEWKALPDKQALSQSAKELAVSAENVDKLSKEQRALQSNATGKVLSAAQFRNFSVFTTVLCKTVNHAQTEYDRRQTQHKARQSTVAHWQIKIDGAKEQEREQAMKEEQIQQRRAEAITSTTHSDTNSFGHR